MHLVRSFRRLSPIILSALLMTSTLATGTAGAATDPPSLRLRTTQTHAVVERPRNTAFQFDPGVYVTPVGGPFELDLRAAAIGDPIKVRQVWPDGATVDSRALPTSMLSGWNGLGDFLHITVHNAAGKLVHHESRAFCPNSANPQRLKPSSVSDPTYPAFCGATFNPFLQGNRWGIDHGWAVDPLATGFFFGPGPFFGDGIRLRLPNGVYQVKTAIAGRYVGLFHIDPARAVATVTLRVKNGSSNCPPLCPGDAAPRPGGGTPTWLPSAPVTGPPDPQYLPDLNALPAFQVFTYSHRGHDYLSFGATEWVGGGSGLDVQGFRRHNANTMDAYQYFFKDGQVVGRAKVGTLEFDTRPGHNHWHFEQFARYRLLDHTQALAVRSHKQSFCIAPSDAIDLTLPGATARPDIFGFLGNCGTPTSVWVHESMPLGWGDTYLQNVAGQAFNITDLPNGTYYISVEVNPLGLLYEQSTANDTALRRVVITGTPGHRHVCVPAVNGVDQEGTCKA
jgi:hypothetical protein